MAFANDTRGWIMTALSGIACTLGGSIICVDLIVRLFPGQKGFRIQDSNAFLSSSLSLSFGVMIFSALSSMYPTARRSMIDGGFSPQAAAWTQIVCFLGGAVGIQILSRILHHYMPSHVVDCDHTHGEEEEQQNGYPDKRYGLDVYGRRRSSQLIRSHHSTDLPHGDDAHPHHSDSVLDGAQDGDEVLRRPSLDSRWASKVQQLVSGSKAYCDRDGQCYGFSDPCGQECFKIVQARGGAKGALGNSHRQPSISRSNTVPPASAPPTGERPGLQDVDEGTPLLTTQSLPPDLEQQPLSPRTAPGINACPRKTRSTSSLSSNSMRSLAPHTHHHHVPTNAFLSIGLQTSLAIALHKLPEGFITYATNHANPRLGFAVFLALFIHNITEGFAMALPLYLALNSRWKALFWSSLLGGASQPLGAGVAALWFKVARNHGDGQEPGEGVYGAMFAITSGIMASVALQLFSESQDLTHNRNLCMIFAFIGIGILGFSNALTA